MKKFEFTQDFEGHKKGEIVELDMKTYHEYQHRLTMRGILKKIKTKIGGK